MASNNELRNEGANHARVQIARAIMQAAHYAETEIAPARMDARSALAWLQGYIRDQRISDAIEVLLHATRPE